MSDTNPATPRSGRVLLGVYKAPKPIGEMTEAEWDALAAVVYEAIRTALRRAPLDGRGSRPRRAARRDGTD